MATSVPIPGERRCFEKAPPVSAPRARERPADRARSSDGRELECRRCRAAITTRADAIRVSGSHEHTFFNPAGFVYEIGCFSLAPGCVEIGSPTEDFSWFPGYAWRLALCGSCGIHLGWHFSGRTPHFYGLIIERIVGEDHRPPSS